MFTSPQRTAQRGMGPDLVVERIEATRLFDGRQEGPV
jgi:hypothetical protein